MKVNGTSEVKSRRAGAAVFVAGPSMAERELLGKWSSRWWELLWLCVEVS
jgi:hypothetical protein